MVTSNRRNKTPKAVSPEPLLDSMDATGSAVSVDAAYPSPGSGATAVQVTFPVPDVPPPPPSGAPPPTAPGAAAITKRMAEDEEFATRYRRYQMAVWVVTFLQYATFHLSRRPYSVVKSAFFPDEDHAEDAADWEPFVGSKGKRLLGLLDTIFLATYAIGLFGAGHIADRSNLRIFLAIGLMGVALGLALWPLGYAWGIHSFAYYVFANVFTGLMQASGWPAVVAVMSHWFAKGNRGCIMGVWNAHTSIGNMIGVVVATGAMRMGTTGGEHSGVPGWVYAFAIPAIITAVIAVFSFFALVPTPADAAAKIDASYPPSNGTVTINALAAPEPTEESMEMSERAPAAGEGKEGGVTFLQALLLPGVLEFSFVLFFTKLVAYTFLFWLPYYLESTGYATSVAGYLSTAFDMGGIVGGVFVGYLSDRTGKSALISSTALLTTIPMLLAFRGATEVHLGGVVVTVILMILLGGLVNGPYALITTAVSADLGTHPKLGDDASALATVSGIIDGFGTAGAAAQGILIALVASDENKAAWDRVFFLLMGACGIAALLLVRLVRKDIRDACAKKSPAAAEGDEVEGYDAAGGVTAQEANVLAQEKYVNFSDEVGASGHY